MKLTDYDIARFSFLVLVAAAMFGLLVAFAKDRPPEQPTVAPCVQEADV